MKPLVTALGALALSSALTAIAAAQEARPQDVANGPAASSAQTAAPDSAQPRAEPAAGSTPVDPFGLPPGSPLPVAEAKKRYLATQERLRNVLQGGRSKSVEALANLKKQALLNEAQAAVAEAELQALASAVRDPRDRVRTAVAEDFAARRQLQQAELAELEARVERIKRVMGIRDAMRDTLIDQRTDELLEQMDDDGPHGRSGASAAPGRGRTEHTDAAGSDAPAPVRKTDLERQALDLKRRFIDAKTNFDLAERAQKRAIRQYQNGAISKEVLDDAERNLEIAKNWLDRETLYWDTFHAFYPDLSARKEPSGDDRAVGDRPKNERVTKLGFLDAEIEVQQAKENLSTATNLYDYSKKMHAKGYVSGHDVESKASTVRRAELQLERAIEKRKTIDPPPASDRAVEEQPKTSPDQSAIDESQIIWGPKDTDRIPASAGEPIGSIQVGHIIEPKQAAYAPGDVLTVKLFLRYSGKQPVKFAYPRSEILERLGLHVDLRDAGKELNWGWGPAHQQPARSGHNLMDLSPGGIYSFPPIKVLVGPAELIEKSDEPDLFAYLDVKPGQAAQLSLKLTGDPAQGGILTLATRPFEFRVEAPPKEPQTGDEAITNEKPR